MLSIPETIMLVRRALKTLPLFAMSAFVLPLVQAQTLAGISPDSAFAGGAAFTLTIDGSTFTSSSIVWWGSSTQLTTTFVSAAQLTAAVPANLLSSASTVGIAVGPSTGPTSNI